MKLTDSKLNEFNHHNNEAKAHGSHRNDVGPLNHLIPLATGTTSIVRDYPTLPHYYHNKLHKPVRTE